MTTDAFAGLLQARRTGPDRWLARCPVHGPDRHPSLAITQGRDAVLLRCWSHGCTPESICAALGLTMRDLFDDAGLTPQQRREAAQRSQERDAKTRAQHHEQVERNRELLRLECLRDAVGGRLARRPDDAVLCKLFHEVCDRLHDAESAMPSHADGPLRLPEASAVPQWIQDSLVELGQNFDEVKGPLDAGLERIA